MTLLVLVLAFTISEILACTIFYLSNLGQGSGVQHSQRYHFIWRISTSIKVSRHFTQSLTVFEILTLQMFDLENVGKNYGLQHV